MEDSFETFTEQFTTAMGKKPEVLVLLAAGSTASPEFRDQWSDHDFVVVTKESARGTLFDSHDWVPNHESILFSAWHPPSVQAFLYSDGHKLECTVYSPNEIETVSLGEHRVLFDRANLAQNFQTAAPQPVVKDEALRNLQLVCWTLHQRVQRGEILSARQWQQLALDLFLTLDFAEHSDSDGLDPLDLRRRLEKRSPSLAADLDRLLRLPPTEFAPALLSLAQSRFADTTRLRREVEHVMEWMKR